MITEPSSRILLESKLDKDNNFESSMQKMFDRYCLLEKKIAGCKHADEELDQYMERQENTLRAIISIEAFSLLDIYYKLKIWKEEHPDIDGYKASQTDQIAISAINDMKKYIHSRLSFEDTQK